LYGLSVLVLTCLGLSGLAWTCLDLSGLVWAFWACLDLSVLVWAYLGLSLHVLSCLGLPGQSSKKTKNVRYPNLGIKMSDFHISVNNSLIMMIIFKNIVLKLLVIHLWLIAINLCFISA
jgi:hypothetical protein